MASTRETRARSRAQQAAALATSTTSTEQASSTASAGGSGRQSASLGARAARSAEEKFMEAMGGGGVVRVRGVEAEELALKCLAMHPPSGRPIVLCLQSAVAVDMVARRVAYQVGSEVGLVVGKVTPLVEMRGPETRLVVSKRCTLQKEVEEDPTLARYGMVVVDEVGNSSKGHLDHLLKLRLKEAVRRRGELVVVLGAGEGEEEARLDRWIFGQLTEVRLASPPPTTLTSLSCPICLDSLAAVTKRGGRVLSTVCGHVFCGRCLPKCLSSTGACPTCRIRLAGLHSYHSLFLG